MLLHISYRYGGNTAGKAKAVYMICSTIKFVINIILIISLLFTGTSLHFHKQKKLTTYVVSNQLCSTTHV